MFVMRTLFIIALHPFIRDLPHLIQILEQIGVQKTNTGAPLRFDAKDVDEAVCSWLQEEKDMALILR